MTVVWMIGRTPCPNALRKSPQNLLTAASAQAQISLSTVTIGNAGNAADSTTGYGAVGYSYNIGTTEVTLTQYTAFLNAVAATDTYGLYNTSLGTDLNIKGIVRSGSSGAFSYAVSGSGARPVTYVSWYDAARFTNWLGNGQPTGLQTSGTTETGAYTLTGNTGNPTKNGGASYWVPSEDEWYKPISGDGARETRETRERRNPSAG